MCTAVTMRAKDGAMLMARTMDFSYPLEPRQEKYKSGRIWRSAAGGENIRVRYSFEGIGQNGDAAGRTVLFADGVNENGLCAAALYFPGYARYDEPVRSSRQMRTIAAYEVVPYLLGSCACVQDAVSVLRGVRIVGVPDAVTGIAAPLHWIIADRTGMCVTAEKTASGLHIYENETGVLTNSPDFGWHMTNLRNYVGVVPYRPEEADWGSVMLSPLGQGDGTAGLPGGYTPPARFVRAAWLKSHTEAGADFDEILSQARCILGNVSIPKGCVVTERGSIDYTQYTVFFRLTEPDIVVSVL